MANIKTLYGSDKLREMYPKVNENFTDVNGEVNDLRQRVDNIITTPIDGEAAAQELVDARDNETSLSARLNRDHAELTSHMADIAKQPQVIAYVETWGSDSTGEKELPWKPFKTIDAALTALPDGGMIKIGRGRFAPPSDYTLIKEGHCFQGSGQPSVNVDYTGLVDDTGTILEGTFWIVNKSNVKVMDLGIDVGVEVCTRLYEGATQHGFLRVTDTGEHILVTPNAESTFKNMTIICKNATSTSHAFLCEGVDRTTVDNIITYYGRHGIVFKAIKCNASNLQAYGSGTNGVVVKTSEYAVSRYVNLNNVVIADINGEGKGLRVKTDTVNCDISHVNISNVHISGVEDGLILENEGVMNTCNFDNFTFRNVTGNIILFTGTGTMNRNHFTNFNAVNVLGNGIAMVSGCNNNIFSNIKLIGDATNVGVGIISDGANNKFNMYEVKGFTTNNFVHTNTDNEFINPIGLGTYTYKSLTYVNDFDNYSGTQAQGNVWKEGNRVYLEGLLSGASAGTVGSTITTLPSGYRPEKNVRFVIACQGEQYAIIDIAPTGVMTLSFLSGAGGWLALDGINFRASNI